MYPLTKKAKREKAAENTRKGNGNGKTATASKGTKRGKTPKATKKTVTASQNGKTTKDTRPVKITPENDPAVTGAIITLRDGKTKYPPYVKIRHSQAHHEKIQKAASKAEVSVVQFCADAVTAALKRK